jgi:DNA polymerase-3 subunit alpha
VNHSEWSFTPDGEAIRFGMGAVKNLGQSAVEAIGKAREEVGRFTSLHQFCEKVDLGSVNRRMIESLIKAGAMDSLEGTRSQKWAAVEGAMEAGQRAQRDRECGQVGLFGEMLDADEAHSTPLPNVPDWTDKGSSAAKGVARLLGHWTSAGPLYG